MEEKDLDIKIKSLFVALDKKLTKEEKKSVHFKSISNFVFYLVYHPYINPKKNKKLQLIGETRMKRVLLDYLESIDAQEKVKKQKPKSIHNTPIGIIGSFMSEYYRFTGSGGLNNSLVAIFLTCSLGVVVDFFMSLIFSKLFFAFTLSSVSIVTLRSVIKHKQRRVYGINY